MPARRMTPAAKALPRREVRIHMSALWSIPAEPSGSTAKHVSVSTTRITNVLPSMWTFREMAHASASRHAVRHLSKNSVDMRSGMWYVFCVMEQYRQMLFRANAHPPKALCAEHMEQQAEYPLSPGNSSVRRCQQVPDTGFILRFPIGHLSG